MPARKLSDVLIDYNLVDYEAVGLGSGQILTRTICRCCTRHVRTVGGNWDRIDSPVRGCIDPDSNACSGNVLLNVLVTWTMVCFQNMVDIRDIVIEEVQELFRVKTQ